MLPPAVPSPRRTGLPIALALALVLLALFIARPLREQLSSRLGGATGLPRMQWTRGAYLSTPRDDFGMAIVRDQLYVLGGMTGARGNKLDTVEIYDPTTDRWSPGPTMTLGRSSFRAVSINELIYVVGGQTEEEPTTDLVESLDTRAGEWKRLAPLPTPRFGHGLVELRGRIWAIGGYHAGKGVATVDIYDPATDRWTAGAPLPTPRYNLSAVVLDGKIYALGGWLDDKPSTVVEVYDPSTNRWTTDSSLGAAMSNFGATVLDGRIHALHHRDHQVFDPAAKRWRSASPMPTTRHGQGVIAMKGKLYAIGGCYEDPQYDLNVTEVLTSSPSTGAIVATRARLGGDAGASVVSTIGLALVIVTPALVRRWRLAKRRSSEAVVGAGEA